MKDVKCKISGAAADWRGESLYCRVPAKINSLAFYYFGIVTTAAQAAPAPAEEFL